MKRLANSKSQPRTGHTHGKGPTTHCVSPGVSMKILTGPSRQHWHREDCREHERMKIEDCCFSDAFRKAGRAAESIKSLRRLCSRVYTVWVCSVHLLHTPDRRRRRMLRARRSTATCSACSATRSIKSTAPCVSPTQRRRKLREGHRIRIPSTLARQERRRPSRRLPSPPQPPSPLLRARLPARSQRRRRRRARSRRLLPRLRLSTMIHRACRHRSVTPAAAR